MKIFKVMLAAVCAASLLACPAPNENMDAGSGGGVGTTGGGTGATGGGSATGGGEGTGGGGNVVDAGTDAGVDAGTGNPCDSATHDAVLGTLVLSNGATVVRSAQLPGNVFGVGVVNGTIYSVSFTNTLRALGTLPTLTPGPELTSIIAPEDRDGGSRFAGGYIAANGTELLTGYTRPDFGGSVLIYETSDAGVRYVSAAGNYSAASVNGAWLVNGLGLGPVSTPNIGIYALDSQGAFGFTEFPASSASGYTATTSEGVLLLGYYGNGSNRVHAVPASTYAAALTGRTSFALTAGEDLAIGSDAGLAALSTVGTDGLLVRSNSAYRTTRVDVLPLTLSGSGVQSVTAGAPVIVVNSVDECTTVKFAVGAGTTFLLGVEDKNGERIVEVQP